MKPEHQTHHAHAADRFIRGVGDIAVGTADRRKSEGIFFATGRGGDRVLVDVGEQGVFITGKIIIARLGQREDIEFRHRTGVVG